MSSRDKHVQSHVIFYNDIEKKSTIANIKNLVGNCIWTENIDVLPIVQVLEKVGGFASVELFVASNWLFLLMVHKTLNI